MTSPTPLDILNAAWTQNVKCLPVECRTVGIGGIFVGHLKSLVVSGLTTPLMTENGRVKICVTPCFKDKAWIPRYVTLTQDSSSVNGKRVKLMFVPELNDIAWNSPNLDPATIRNYGMQDLYMTSEDMRKAHETFVLFVWEQMHGVKLLPSGRRSPLRPRAAIQQNQDTEPQRVQPPPGLSKARQWTSGEEGLDRPSSNQVQQPPDILSFLKSRPKIAQLSTEKPRTVNEVVKNANKQPIKRKPSDQPVVAAPAKRTRTSKAKAFLVADECSAAKSKGIPWHPPARMDEDDDEQVQPGQIADDKKLILRIKDEEDAPPDTKMAPKLPTKQELGDMEDIDSEIEKSQIKQAQLQAEKDQLQARMEEVQLKQKKAALNKKRKVGE